MCAIDLEDDINYFTEKQENLEARLRLSLLCLLDHCFFTCWCVEVHWN